MFKCLYTLWHAAGVNAILEEPQQQSCPVICVRLGHKGWAAVLPGITQGTIELRVELARIVALPPVCRVVVNTHGRDIRHHLMAFPMPC